MRWISFPESEGNAAGLMRLKSACHKANLTSALSLQPYRHAENPTQLPTSFLTGCAKYEIKVISLAYSWGAYHV
jgi:hypothetical protein